MEVASSRFGRLKKLKIFRKVWNRTLQLLGFNWMNLLLFTLINSFGNVVVSYTIYYAIIDICMALRGDRYVDSGAFSASLHHPLVIFIMIIGALLMAMISIFQVSGYTYIFYQSSGRRKAGLFETFSMSVSCCLKSFLPQNWPIIVLLFGLIPALRIITVSSNYLEFFIPEFVRDYIDASQVLNLVYWGSMLLFFITVIVYLFSMNYYFLGNENFIRSCTRSRKLIGGNFLFTALTVFLIAGFFFILNVGISAVISELIVTMTSFFRPASETNIIYDNLQVANISLSLRMIASEIIAPVFTLAAVSALHFVLLEEEPDKAEARLVPDTQKTRKNTYVIAAGLCFLACLGYYIFTQTEVFDHFYMDSERPLIAAHRGDSIRAPENTYPAFELAALENPDGMIELDIQKTKDGVILVSHNDSLKKFTGDNRAIHELTYEEIMEIDVGSWFSPAYEGLKLSTLDEILKLIKNYENLYVQIEIKVAEYDHHLEEELIEILYANDMVKRCAVISLSPEPLRRIKALDPDITTLYTMSMAIGDISTFDAADGYSVEQSFITLPLVSKVHAAGKKIYAWTANTGSTIQFLTDCGVDGILTDDPIMLKEALDNIYYSGGFLRLFRIYISMLYNF